MTDKCLRWVEKNADLFEREDWVTIFKTCHPAHFKLIAEMLYSCQLEPFDFPSGTFNEMLGLIGSCMYLINNEDKTTTNTIYRIDIGNNNKVAKLVEQFGCQYYIDKNFKPKKAGEPAHRNTRVCRNLTEDYLYDMKEQIHFYRLKYNKNLGE